MVPGKHAHDFFAHELVVDHVDGDDIGATGTGADVADVVLPTLLPLPLRMLLLPPLLLLLLPSPSLLLLLLLLLCRNWFGCSCCG
jgi:hypothetical protein